MGSESMTPQSAKIRTRKRYIPIFSFGCLLILSIFLTATLIGTGGEGDDTSNPTEASLVVSNDENEISEFQDVPKSDIIPIPPSSESLDTTLKGDEAPAIDPCDKKGWRVSGTVKDPQGMPISNAKVLLQCYAETGGHFNPMDPAVTDEEGVYSVDIPTFKELDEYSYPFGSPFSIFGTAMAPGYVPGSDTSHNSLSPNTVNLILRLDIVLKPGCVLYGRVVTKDDIPVVEADVILTSTEKKTRNRIKTDRNGCYAIPINRAGKHVLYAEKIGSGVSSAAFVELDSNSGMEAPTLILQECGFIAGTALDPDGNPIEGLRIHAFQEVLLNIVAEDLEDNSKDYKHAGRSISDTGSCVGIPFGTVLTGPDGRFRISGLKQGNYFLWLPVSFRSGDQPPCEIPRILYQTGTGNARIVADVHRLKVHLRDEKGLLLPFVKVTLNCEWSWGEEYVNGIFNAQVPPGPLKITAKAWGDLFAEETLEIKAGNYCTEMDLVLKKNESPGRVRLIFTGPDGKKVRQFSNLTVSYCGEKSIRPMSLSMFEMDTNSVGDFILTLLPDTYTITAYPNGTMDRCLPIQAENICVKPEKQIKVHFPLRMGGQLRLTILSSVKDDLKIYHVIAKPASGKAGLGDKPSLRKFYPHGQEKAVYLKDLKPGIPYLSPEVFEEGLYTLELKARGFEPVEQSFSISPGQVTDATVVLQPSR